MIEKIHVSELHARFRAQEVEPERVDLAFRCVVCGQVQSMRSFMALGGLSEEAAARQVGFACVGRVLGSGPAVAALYTGGGRRSQPAPGKVGCDWSLGGLLRLHRLEVETEDGQVHPTFEPVGREEAHALRSQLLARAEP